MAALPVKPSSPPPCRVIPCQPHRQDTCHLRYDSSSETLGELPVRVLPIYFEVKAGRMFWRKEPTSGLEPLSCSLRVIHQALQGYAGDCECRIPKGVSFLRVAACCTVLHSRWYQFPPRIPFRLRTFSCQVYDLLARHSRALWSYPPHVGILHTAMVKGSESFGVWINASTLP